MAISKNKGGIIGISFGKKSQTSIYISMKIS